MLGNFIDITVLCVQFQNDRATVKEWWVKGILWDLSLLYVSERYPTSQQPLVSYTPLIHVSLIHTG